MVGTGVRKDVGTTVSNYESPICPFNFPAPDINQDQPLIQSGGPAGQIGRSNDAVGHDHLRARCYEFQNLSYLLQ